MSGPAAPPRRRLTAPALIAGLAVALACVPGASGQPPAPIPGSVEDADPTPPLPPDGPRPRPTAAQYRIDPDKRMYAEIADDAPLQAETQNANEYAAWTEVVKQARRFPAAELEQFARTDLTAGDLTHPIRRDFQLTLLKLEGKVTKARQVPTTRALQADGLPYMYEAWLNPLDEPPGVVVCVAFTDLPPGVGDPSKLVGQWVTAAGYYFKLMRYPGPTSDPKLPPRTWDRAPLLVARSLTPGFDPAPPAARSKCRLNTDLRIYTKIADNARITAARVGNDAGWENWEEGAAYERLLLAARRYSVADLEAAARRDLTFADLFLKGREDYKLDLVRVEGRLIRLRKEKEKLNPRLQEAGLEARYEGWLIPDGEPRGNPVCVVMSEVPESLKAVVDGGGPPPILNEHVSFAGYSFKLFQYDSAEKRKDDPERNVVKAAPLLIGRGLTLHQDEAGSSWGTTFVPVVVGSLLVMIGSAGGLTWWFRRGDRRARAEIDAVRGANPFSNVP